MSARTKVSGCCQLRRGFSYRCAVGVQFRRPVLFREKLGAYDDLLKLKHARHNCATLSRRLGLPWYAWS